MKIEPGIKPIPLAPSAETRPSQASPDQGVITEQTQVTLSSRVNQLNEMEAQLATIPVVDRARVDSIKAAIAAGQYPINAEHIADMLLTSAKEMLHVAK